MANTPQTLLRGLMGRPELPADHGMLFDFAVEARHCLWMKDTPHPLAAAFVDRQGRIVNTVEMAAESLDYPCAAGPVRYALEMPAGWFARKGVQAGARVTGLPQAHQ